MKSFKQFISENSAANNRLSAPGASPVERTKEKHRREKESMIIRQNRELAQSREDKFRQDELERERKRKQKEIEKQRTGTTK
jgi:hypothetical protein